MENGGKLEETIANRYLTMEGGVDVGVVIPMRIGLSDSIQGVLKLLKLIWGLEGERGVGGQYQNFIDGKYLLEKIALALDTYIYNCRRVVHNSLYLVAGPAQNPTNYYVIIKGLNMVYYMSFYFNIWRWVSPIVVKFNKWPCWEKFEKFEKYRLIYDIPLLFLGVDYGFQGKIISFSTP